MHKKILSLREIALFSMLGALTFGMKVAMSYLPNIEPTSLMVMLFAVVFGWKGLYPLYLYVMLELLVYGLGFWNINYLYVWTVLFLGAMFARPLKSPVWWALLSGVFGLIFGLLCCPPYAVMGGWSYAIRWWQAGLVFDVYHAVGNTVIALFLFVPLRKLLTRLYAKF